METIYAYIAGIIDGEGCISIRKVYRKNKTQVFYIPMIEVGMTHRKTIEFIAKTFGGSVWYEVIRKSGKNQHKWRKAGTHIIPVLQKVFPYLITKKKQAIVALSFASLIGKRGHKWSITERAYQNSIRIPLFKKMYSLNHLR